MPADTTIGLKQIAGREAAARMRDNAYSSRKGATEAGDKAQEAQARLEEIRKVHAQEGIANKAVSKEKIREMLLSANSRNGRRTAEAKEKTADAYEKAADAYEEAAKAKTARGFEEKMRDAGKLQEKAESLESKAAEIEKRGAVAEKWLAMWDEEHTERLSQMIAQNKAVTAVDEMRSGIASKAREKEAQRDKLQGEEAIVAAIRGLLIETEKKVGEKEAQMDKRQHEKEAADAKVKTAEKTVQEALESQVSKAMKEMDAAMIEQNELSKSLAMAEGRKAPAEDIKALEEAIAQAQQKVKNAQDSLMGSTTESKTLDIPQTHKLEAEARANAAKALVDASDDEINAAKADAYQVKILLDKAEAVAKAEAELTAGMRSGARQKEIEALRGAVGNAQTAFETAENETKRMPEAQRSKIEDRWKAAEVEEENAAKDASEAISKETLRKIKGTMKEEAGIKYEDIVIKAAKAKEAYVNKWWKAEMLEMKMELDKSTGRQQSKADADALLVAKSEELRATVDLSTKIARTKITEVERGRLKANSEAEPLVIAATDSDQMARYMRDRAAAMPKDTPPEARAKAWNDAADALNRTVKLKTQSMKLQNAIDERKRRTAQKQEEKEGTRAINAEEATLPYPKEAKKQGSP